MIPKTKIPLSKSGDWSFLAGLLLITLVSFWPVGRLGFIGYDDVDYVYQNAHVQSGLTFDSISWAFTSADASNWHPVTWLSLMLDCELFGVNPQEEHWVNLGFHIANTLLIFVFLRQLTGARWRSFFVAALFACHPMHVQSVAWISERKDVLSGFFCILTLMAYTRSCSSKVPGRSVSRYWMAWFCLALGLMSKPMLVTLPLIMLLLDLWPLGRITLTPSASLFKSVRPLLVEKFPMFALCVLSSLITLAVQKSGGAVISTQNIPWSDRCIHSIVAYTLYLDKFIWPTNLAIYYPFPSTNPNILKWSYAFLLLAALTLVCWRRRLDKPYLLVGWLSFLIMLVPVIGLVQVGMQSIADRYSYLPYLGLFIILAWGMKDLADSVDGRKCDLARATGSDIARINSCARFSGPCDGIAGWVIIGAGALIVVACMADTRYQLRFWKNNTTLFEHVVNVTPENNYLGYFYLGISHAEQGDLPDAEWCLRKTLEIKPGLALAVKRLGTVLFMEKKYTDAEVYLRELAQAFPNDAGSQLSLGLDLSGEKRFLEAQAEYQVASQLAPNDTTINLILAKNTPKADAMTTLSTLMSQLATNSSPEIDVQIGVENTVLGNYMRAAEHYEKALALNTNTVAALNNLAWLRATCPDASVRNGPQAVQLAEHACELTHFNTTLFLGTLAAAQAEAGQFDNAIITAQKACANASAKGETELLEHNQELLALYQQHEAYHETDGGPVP